MVGRTFRKIKSRKVRAALRVPRAERWKLGGTAEAA